MDLVLADEAATAALAQQLAPALRPGEVLRLDGPLGAGKTTFVRALVTALGGEAAAVASPTFTLMHRYDTQPVVWHVDAYRLDPLRGLASLGLPELADDGLLVVEWAERLGPPAASDWCLSLAPMTGDGAARHAQVTVPGGRTWTP
jgi:tRNA threonylcarbamoyl adenosine modification protein YjeE